MANRCGISANREETLEMPRAVTRKHPKTPEKLAAKLLAIRQQLKESQNGMIVCLGLEGDFDRGYVSKWERGLLEPPLYVLCAYADAGNIFLEVLARDNFDLPPEIPAKMKSMGSASDQADLA